MKDIHGGNIYSYQNKLLDFSANINPLGMPTSVKMAIIDAIDQCVNYPDPFCRELKEAISLYENIDNSTIFCGNGAADIIYRVVLAKKPKTAIVLAPTFSEYEQALTFSGCKTFYHHLDPKHFILDETILTQIKNCDMFFICNPNNPTGVLTPPLLMEEIIRTASMHNCLVVVDECFLPFVDNGEEYSVKRLLPKYDNVLILKAFTKIFAMAGVRLGYSLMNNPNFIDRMELAGSTWNVSHLAQKAGVAAVLEKNFVYETIQLIKKERTIFKENLENHGFHVFESSANYLFFKSEHNNLKEKLLKHGILIRDCSNYPGLTQGYYRVCVRKYSENKILLEKLGG